VERLSGCPESLATSTLEELQGTELPQNFAECVKLMGVSSYDASLCRFGVSRSGDPVLYRQCERAGGVVSVACGRHVEEYACGLSYRCGWRPCLGHGCG
jgi:hypothetical protein